MTRSLNGRVLLRIEDHDRQRSRAAYERAILEDLEWLGFVPDAPPMAAFRAGRCEGRQSDRTAAYEDALARLSAAGLVYACDCTRHALVPGAGGERRYPGTCADRGLPIRDGVALRVRLAPSIERFVDLLHREQAQCPAAQCGDVLVRDRDANWTYQFAVTVDDLTQGVTLVIRGDDLLDSTGRQIQLARLLGRDRPPRFLHHPLIMKSTTQKLSKADRDTSIADLRARGWAAADVIGEAAARVGLLDAPHPVEARDAPDVVMRSVRSVRGVRL